MPRITKKMIAEMQAKEQKHRENTNRCIALLTQKLNIDIDPTGSMYMNCVDFDDEDNAVIPLRFEGKIVKSTFVVGSNIDPDTEIAFDPYNNTKLLIGLLNLYIEMYYPFEELLTLSISNKHTNKLGIVTLRFRSGLWFESDEYYKDSLKYIDILYRLDGSTPPEFRKIRELDEQDTNIG